MMSPEMGQETILESRRTSFWIKISLFIPPNKNNFNVEKITTNLIWLMSRSAHVGGNDYS